MSLNDPDGARERLRGARLCLVFTPELCGGREPLGVLEAVLPWIDLIQVRPKPLAGAASEASRSAAPGEARAAYEWTARVLALLAGRSDAPPIIVNDRVDVALVLARQGAAGVHLGQDDLPVADARALLGQDALIGLSTHGAAQVAEAALLPLDYLGYGPVFPTRTKGYERGLGAEACWIASSAARVPVFAIGGVTPERAIELRRTGRAAVGSAILSAPDPCAAARALRALLGDE